MASMGRRLSKNSNWSGRWYLYISFQDTPQLFYQRRWIFLPAWYETLLLYYVRVFLIKSGWVSYYVTYRTFPEFCAHFFNFIKTSKKQTLSSINRVCISDVKYSCRSSILDIINWPPYLFSLYFV